MKFFILSLLMSLSLFAKSMILDEIYDDYEDKELVLKLIDDNKIEEARKYYSTNIGKKTLEKHYDAFFKGVFLKEPKDKSQALNLYFQSLHAKFSIPAFIHSIDLITKEKLNHCHTDEFNLTKNMFSILSLNQLQEKIFTQWLKHCEELGQFQQLFTFVNNLNTIKFQIDLFYIKTDYLLKNKIIFVAFQQTKNLFINEENLKLFQALNIIELFKKYNLLTEAESLIEVSKLRFGAKDEILILLAQLNLAKENYFLASHYLQRLQNKSSVVYIVLAELVIKTNNSMLSPFYRLLIDDSKEYLKSQLVYLIQNEKWIQVYSQYENVKTSTLQNKEIFYALSYSSGLIKDKAHEDLFLNLSKQIK